MPEEPKTSVVKCFTQDATGIHYQNDDGTIVTSSWVEVNNLWFLFDANGDIF